MSSTTDAPNRVAVIGGGISGLAAAHRLHELAPTWNVTLMESGNRLGGSLNTVEKDGFHIEEGADNFITTVPYAMDLCRRIGMGDQLVQTNDQHRTAFVVCRGRLQKIPEGFVIMAPGRIWPIVSTPIISLPGKIRMALEYFVRKRTSEAEESLAEFVTRRFGRETYDRLVQPLVGGIYTGDPEKLSVQATMPRFVEMERQHGSLIRAMYKQKAKQKKATQHGSGARYSLFVAPKNGMNSLIQTLAGRLPQSSIRRNAPVKRLTQRPEGGWSLTVGEGPQSETLDFDAVILATKALAAGKLIEPIDATVAECLSSVPHASCSIVSLGYRRDQIEHPMDGFGFVVPAIERRQVLSGSFSSVKYPGRAPDGQVLIRVFVGGILQAALSELPDDQLTETATGELAKLMGVRGEPIMTHISRYPKSMPQYYVGHMDRMAQVREASKRLPGLYFAGNMFDGVGMPYCIHNSEQIAEQIVQRSSVSAGGEVEPKQDDST